MNRLVYLPRVYCRPVRRAFTLVELLVVIAIIGVLIGMLLPAVQMVRESARRTDCANKLKQMGLAMQSFEATHGHFPSSYNADQWEPGWSWATQILPFVEHENLYEFGEVTEQNFEQEPTEYSQTEVTLFRCPSDLGPTLNHLRLNHAMSNYRSPCGPEFGDDYDGPGYDFGGIMYQNSRTKFRDITDGTSNTVVIGECMFDEESGKMAALWPGCTAVHDGFYWISDVMWWVDASSAQINGPAPQAFSSRHPEGALFAFCDGSTRFFIEGGNVEILRFLAGRDDGRIVNPDF